MKQFDKWDTKNGLKLFLKELSYCYAPAFSRDIIVQFFQISNFLNYNKSIMRFINEDTFIFMLSMYDKLRNLPILKRQ